MLVNFRSSEKRPDKQIYVPKHRRMERDVTNVEPKVNNRNSPISNQKDLSNSNNTYCTKKKAICKQEKENVTLVNGKSQNIKPCNHELEDFHSADKLPISILGNLYFENNLHVARKQNNPEHISNKDRYHTENISMNHSSNLTVLQNVINPYSQDLSQQILVDAYKQLNSEKIYSHRRR